MHKRVTTTLLRLHVRAISPRAARGILIAGNIAVPCSVGRSGVVARKREGDGGTPRGEWRLCRLLGRRRLRTSLPQCSIRKRDGWCEVAADRNYNRPVTLPYAAASESLWRADGVYDAIVVLDHNRRPRRRNGGSAVFFHIAHADGRPTAGCVAISWNAMTRVLPLCGPNTRMRIGL